MDTTDDSELRAHQQMWHNFTRFLGYSACAVAAVLAFMALFTL